MSRSRLGYRQASMKARLAIGAAALVGGGAIAAVAVVATSSSAPVTARSAGFGLSLPQQAPFSSTLSGLQLSQLGSQLQQNPTAPAALAKLAGTQTFETVQAGNLTLAAQVGVVVTATNTSVTVQSTTNGTTVQKVWTLNGNTRFIKVPGGLSNAAALAAGDKIFIAGTQANGVLTAKLALFSAATATTSAG